MFALLECINDEWFLGTDKNRMLLDTSPAAF